MKSSNDLTVLPKIIRNIMKINETLQIEITTAIFSQTYKAHINDLPRTSEAQTSVAQQEPDECGGLEAIANALDVVTSLKALNTCARLHPAERAGIERTELGEAITLFLPLHLQWPEFQAVAAVMVNAAAAPGVVKATATSAGMTAAVATTGIVEAAAAKGLPHEMLQWRSYSQSR